MRTDPTDTIIRERLAELLSAGASAKDACRQVGVSWPRFIAAVAEGTRDHENGDEDTAAALLAIECARSEAKARARSLSLVLESQDWRAHTWFLERSDPDTYGKREHVTTSNAEPEDFAAELRKRLAALKGGGDVGDP
jgi:hypothetical protein